MRSNARLVAPVIVLLLAAAGAAPAVSGVALPPATASGDVQVFNVSLKLVGCTKNGTCTGEWKDYFQRLREKGYKPDVLNVLEIPFSKKDTVVAELASAMNTPVGAWDQVHTDKDVTCADLMNCGNSMVVFRVPKFQKLDQSRFLRHEMNAQGECKQGALPNSRDVAVKLQEKDALGTPIPGRVVVAAAVHLPPDLTIGCVEQSSSWIRGHLAGLGGDLSVVTGDFNRPPSGKATGNAETLDERKEVCPAPWYGQWSLPQTTPSSSCPTVFNGSYRDAIRSKHTTAAEICQEWTVWNQVAEADPGACKAGGKRRIDFVWVRRTVGGAVVEPNIVSAGTDRGYHLNPDDWPNRYSDHRALEALLRF